MSAAFVASVAAILVSPFLAAWTDNLIGDVREGWWRPRAVSVRRWLCVAAAAIALAAAGSRGAPALAWWVFAVIGAVLAIVDSQTHRLPARIVCPLAATEVTILAVTALVHGEEKSLIRAGVSSLVVGGSFFLVAVISPAAIGLGDIYVLAIASGLLGWNSWKAVVLGQILTWFLGPCVLIVGIIKHAKLPRSSLKVPMGPVLLAGTLLASYL